MEASPLSTRAVSANGRLKEAGTSIPAREIGCKRPEEGGKERALDRQPDAKTRESGDGRSGAEILPSPLRGFASSIGPGVAGR